MSQTSVPAGEVLRLSREPIELSPTERYTAIGMRSFGKGIFHYPPTPAADLSKLRYFRFPANALALSNIKAWEGAVGVTSDADTCAVASNRFLFYTPIDASRIDVGYVRYYLLSAQGLSALGSASPGSADRNRTLSIAGFESIEVPLPPIDEQRRIARTLSQAVDIAHWSERRRDLQIAAKESLLRYLFEPQGVEKRVGDVMTLVRRPVVVHPARSYREIGIRSFGKGAFHKDPVTGASLGGKRVFEIHSDELVFNVVFAWEGAVAITGDSERGMIASHRFLTYQVDSEIADIRYLHAYFLSPYGASLISAASPGSAGRNRTLGIEAFSAQRMRLPTLAEQRRIADTYGMFTGVLAATERASLLGNALKQSMLNAAFSGEL